MYNSEKEVIVTKEASILDEYTSVIPGSIGEGIFNAICEYYNNN
ncbi:hypothetical protein [uncultured Methanobrevibacter sp.]|nr:hypothetical protein [uncultured Methanobrevibacter sp.]